MAVAAVAPNPSSGINTSSNGDIERGGGLSNKVEHSAVLFVIGGSAIMISSPSFDVGND